MELLYESNVGMGMAKNRISELARRLKNKVRKDKHRRLILLILLALCIRLVFINLDHPWDAVVWNNLFVDLAQDRSPYETLEDQTLDARSRYGVGHAIYFEGYAYPPLPIFIYYPLAKLYGMFYPLEHVVVLAGELRYIQVPWLFDFLFKLPILLADIGIALLLYKMTKRDEKSMKMFLFNPYIIFISAAWMFDSIAVFFLLLSLYLFEKEKYDLSAIFLSLGFLTKFYPIFALPVFCTEFIRRRSWKFLRYMLVFGAVSAVFTLPYLEGFTTSSSFQTFRAPQGMTPFSSFNVVGEYLGEPATFQLRYIIAPAVGVFVLITGMSLIYAYLSKKEMSMRKKLLMTFLAYFIVMKVVNEAHVFMLIPLFILVMYEIDPVKKIRMAWGFRTSLKRLYYAIWVLPLVFAIINVPITHFLINFTSDKGLLTLLGLSDIPKGIILGILLFAFHIVLWISLFSLKRWGSEKTPGTHSASRQAHR